MTPNTFLSRSATWKRPFLAALLLATATLASAAPAKKCMLWRVSDGKTTGYLIGSIHVGTPDMYPLPKPMTKAFDESKLLLVEIDLNKLDQGKMQQMVQEKGMYLDGDTLSKHISKEADKKLGEFATKNGMPPMVLEMMRPWMAALMVEVLPMLKSGGVDKDLGVDMHFLKEAAGKKQVEGVETMDFQLALISSQPEKVQVAGLESALADVGKNSDALKQITVAWLNGDAAKLDSMDSAETNPDLVAFNKKLVEDRNPHMADVIDHRLKSGIPTLMVVGSAHIVGAKGVAAILRGRGFKVDQLDTDGNPVLEAIPAEKPADKSTGGTGSSHN